MKSLVVTLFEGDYHLGAAALINSLVAAGFTGTVVCGYRGPLPPWAPASGTIGTAKVEFLRVETKTHFTNYKPEFMLQMWRGPHADAASIYYFDPDIVIRARWSFFEEWANYGVALVEDVNSPLPETHPRRAAWRRCLNVRQQLVRRDTPLYVNGGFIGVARAHEGFLHEWATAMTLVGEEIGGLDRSMFSAGTTAPDLASPEHPFSKTDQDALNIALMTASQDVSVMGAEGMDFRVGGWTMAHALGSEKPWRKKFLRAAFAGRPPSRADREFWRHASSPVQIFSPAVTARRRFALGLAALLGRFYHRA